MELGTLVNVRIPQNPGVNILKRFQDRLIQPVIQKTVISSTFTIPDTADRQTDTVRQDGIHVLPT